MMKHTIIAMSLLTTLHVFGQKKEMPPLDAPQKESKKDNNPSAKIDNSKQKVNLVDTIKLLNNSFEKTQPRTDWFDCGFAGERPASIMPTDAAQFTNFDKQIKAFDGEKYMLMRTRDNNTWEALGQKLSAPLAQNSTYEISLFLAHLPNCFTNRGYTNQIANYDLPTVFRIWGGTNYCAKNELLAETKAINHKDWKEYKFTLNPKRNIPYILFEAFYDTAKTAIKPENGNLLLDKISDIVLMKQEKNTSTSNLKKELPKATVQQFFDNVKKVYPNYRVQCEKGYTNAELQAFEQKIGYQLPVSLKEFYQNLRSDRLCLALGWFFQPLYFDANPYQSALYTFQDNPNTVKFAFSGKKRLPIIDDAGGSTIYLDFEPDAKGTYGQVILIFRDYPEIVFRIAKDFDEFLAIMNNEFEQKRVKIDGDKESEDAHLIYEQHNDYFDWVSLSRAQRGVSKIGTDKPMNFDAAWIRALSSKNQEFTRKQAANFLESDLDRVYYVWIFDENIESIEKLALFPNLAQVGFSLKNKTIPQKAWETLAKTRVTSLIINNLLPNSSLDMAQIAKLSHLVELRCGELAASLEDVKNAPYINNNYPFLNVSHIEKLTQLRFLSLSDSTLKNLDFLEKMPQLRTFECRNARLSEPKWQAIKSLKQLIYLNVKGSNFSDFALLKDLTELQTLRFNSHNGTNYASFEQINRPLSMVCDMAFFNKMLDIIIKKKHNLMGVSGTQAERNAEYEANWRKYLASKDKK